LPKVWGKLMFGGLKFPSLGFFELVVTSGAVFI